MMRIVMTLLVRDEEDVIAANLDYHLSRGVDFVVATDNASQDRTPGVLAEYHRRGVLHLINEPGRDYRQEEWVSHMARLAATSFAADWVINADADEFYWPEEATSLKTVLAAVPDRFGSLRVPARNFLPAADGPDGFIDRLLVRETYTRKPLGDAPFVNVIHRAHPDVEVARGNHSVRGPDMDVMDGWEPIIAMHFPMRSAEQFERKIAAGGEPFKPWLSDTERSRAREMYEAAIPEDDGLVAGLREGRLVVDDRLSRYMAARRRSDPPPPPAPAEGAGRRAWPDYPPEIAEIRARAVQTAYLRQHAPPAQELRDLQRQIEGWQSKAEHWRALAHEARHEAESWRGKVEHWRALAHEARQEADALAARLEKAQSAPPSSSSG